MRLRPIRLVVVACALALGGLAAAQRAGARDASAGDGVSEIIFPAQTIPLRFSHVQHLRAKKLDCGFCHEQVGESRSSLDNNIPREEACTTCHEIDRGEPDKRVPDGAPRADCAACHPGFEAGQPVARVVIPSPNIKFDHRAHAARKIRCQVCHGELERDEVGLATREQLPRMAVCLQCHDGQRAPDACTTCHLAEGNGRIVTEYEGGALRPSGALRGDAHDAMWRTSHAAVAKRDAAYCESCHRKDYCIGCHNGSVKPLDFHGNDYVTLHTIDARRNTPDCSACHRTQTFCVGCHSRSGVAYDGKGGELEAPFLEGGSRATFHPEGWVAFGGRGADHHAFEAQRNIKQCASCHREQFCTTCHSAEQGNAYRVNPHPAGWRGSRRCRALARRAGRMCLRCHVDASEVDCE